MCYHIIMKKKTKEEVVKLLKEKKSTYNEIASITGYNPKYLIKLNKELKRNGYHYIKQRRKGNNVIDESIKQKIIDDYLNNKYRSYQEFYNFNKDKYKVSYSFICKLLKELKIEEEVLFIKKVKQHNQILFIAIDYQTKNILYALPSKKNDVKSFKKIIQFILINHGIPKNICFVNCFKHIPNSVIDIQRKYNINLITYKTFFNETLNNALKEKRMDKQFRYKKIAQIIFYDKIERKLIMDNVIQFDNVRYLVKTDDIIKKGEIVYLYLSEGKKNIYIEYKNNKYELKILKKVISKKGLTKYF